jgi:protein-S-isoprenylcysteine O-methyltransferase Ste14
LRATQSIPGLSDQCARRVEIATITALLGVLLIAFGLWQKARMEERFLTTELGADAHGSYCRRVPMLISVPAASLAA